MEAMHLTDKEKEMLEYSMCGWRRTEIAKMLLRDEIVYGLS